MPSSVNTRTSASNEKHVAYVSIIKNDNSTSEATINSLAHQFLATIEAANITINEGETVSIGISKVQTPLSPPPPLPIEVPITGRNK